MSLVSYLLTTTSTRGGWHGLLRLLGVETWFRRVSAPSRAGQQERVFLLLSLLPLEQRDSHITASLESALQTCLPLIGVDGGEVLPHQSHTLLLSWPATSESQRVRAVHAYYQFRHCLHQLAPQLAPALYGAASLGFVQVRPHATGRPYRGEVLRQVRGILHEAQRLGGGLLVSAALRQRLPQTPAFHHTLHVAFDLEGHRYPATLFHTSAIPAL
jgi:hypothetical protein